jgi:lipid-A-disaccharide synthase-like uncharacterized protein
VEEVGRGGTLGFLGIWFAFIFIVQFMGFTLATRAVLPTAFFLLMGGTF